jgi:hypothetical protein
MAFDPNDADTKKAIKEAVEAATAEATAGLLEKNKELLGKLKKAQKDSAIDPAEHAALQEELAATQVKLAEAQKAAKTATTEADKIKKAYESESQVTHRLLVDNGLSEALLKNGIKPEMTKAVKALLSSQVTLKTEGDKRMAVVGDKPLGDFVTEWAKSDEGKHFVAAPANQGGGAHGGAGGGGTQKTMSRTAFDALDATGKMEFTKAGGQLVAD